MNYPITVGGDDDGELGYAIGYASKHAKEYGRIIYLYSDSWMFYITDEFVEDWVAKCWPGGRKVCRRPLE